MLIFIIIICILIVVVAVILSHSKRFKGSRGERKVAKILGKTVKGKKYVINDLLFTYNNNQSCQIDHIYINNHGIWIIETKNYSGTIYGAEEQRQWLQVLANGNVEHNFYNPVMQNKTHLYAIANYLKEKKIFINVVIFTGNADISNIKARNVIKIYKLKNLINSDTGISLSCAQMDDYYDKLLRLKQSSSLTKRKHISNIRKKQKQLKKGICPRCGGRLVLREGKYGEFYGCSNFPECKFTKDIY